METLPEAYYIGALYVAFGLCLGVVADLLIFSYAGKIKNRFFVFAEQPLPWLLKDAAIVILFYLAAQFLFLLALLILKHFIPLPEVFEYYASLFWSTVGVNTATLIFLILYFQKKYRLQWKHFGFYKEKFFSYVRLGGGSYFGFIPVFFFLVLVSALFCQLIGYQPKPHVLVEIFQKEKSLSVIVGLAIFAALIGPVIEEILFRAILYPAVKKRIGAKNAMWITSLFFALIHFNLFQFIPIFGLGMVLAYLYEKTGNLIPSITLHALNNTVSLALTFLLLSFAL